MGSLSRVGKTFMLVGGVLALAAIAAKLSVGSLPLYIVPLGLAILGGVLLLTEAAVKSNR